MQKPRRTDEALAVATEAGIALEVTPTGGDCWSLSATLTGGNVLEVTDGDAQLPGTVAGDTELYAYVHGPDDTDPIAELSTDDMEELRAFLTRWARA